MKVTRANNNYLFQQNSKKYEINFYLNDSTTTIIVRVMTPKKDDIFYKNSFNFSYYQSVNPCNFKSKPGYSNFIHKIEKNEFQFAEEDIYIPNPNGRKNEKIKVTIVSLTFHWDYINGGAPVKLDLNQIDMDEEFEEKKKKERKESTD
ncbi:MAG: hypothetical protein MJ252_02190 [archaeon]|nr:hypothetical protein [archaeon]